MFKRLLYVFLMALVCVSLAYAQAAQLWKTGQTTSYAPGDDGALQKGVAWPDPRFMDNGDGTVTDYLTGLMWLKDANCVGAQSWQNALDVVSSFNANPGNYACSGYTASYNDWRLPNSKELFSLIDRSRYNPAIQQNHPFVNVQTYYWSSTPTPFQGWGTVSTVGSAHYVDMYYGNSAYAPMSVSQNVWPVRSTTTYNLTVTKTGNGTGTVTSSPAGINCGSDCSGTYNQNALVTLTATPDAGSTFDGWSGACTGTGQCTVTMDTAKDVAATFNVIACSYSISPTSQTFSSSGGTGSVNVTTQSSCSWTAVSSATWITITSGSNGTGNGTVNYKVSVNKTKNPRTGTMTIAGQTFTVNQNGR